MRWKTGFLCILAVLLAPRLVADCTSCAKGKPNATIPLIGAVQYSEHPENFTVKVYVDAAAKASARFTKNNLQSAINELNKDCGGYDFIPNFVLAWDDPIPSTWSDSPFDGEHFNVDQGANYANTIVIHFLTGQPAPLLYDNDHNLLGAEGADIRLNDIKVYELCPSGGSPSQHGLDCTGSLINWNEAWGRDAMLHELGHYLGLNHDKGTCSSKRSVMAETRQWNQTNSGLRLTAEHCGLASRMNSITSLCNDIPDPASSNTCEVCHYVLGGSIEGLVGSETVTIHAEVVDEGHTESYELMSGDSRFMFEDEVPDGADYTISVTVSNPQKFCTVANESGKVDGDDVNVVIKCQCDSSNLAGAQASVAGDVCMDKRDPGPLHDPSDVPQVVDDLCSIFPAFCSGINPWWWTEPGPGIGTAPCQRTTTCTDGAENCFTNPETGREECGPTLNCYDHCIGGSQITLRAPRVTLDGLGNSPAQGLLRVTGYAEDADGLLALWIYVDGEKVDDTLIATGTFRPDACSGLQGDCDVYSGFEAELDTTQWSNGEHRFDASRWMRTSTTPWARGWFVKSRSTTPAARPRRRSSRSATGWEPSTRQGTRIA